MCNDNCDQGRQCDCGDPLAPAKGIKNGLIADAPFWLMVGCVFTILSMLSGCAAIDVHTAPPPDWPKLTKRLHKVSLWEVQIKCGSNLLVQNFACAVIRFDKNTCDVWYAEDGPAEDVIEHEYGASESDPNGKGHCDGYDHIGSSVLRDAWEEYKKSEHYKHSIVPVWK